MSVMFATDSSRAVRRLLWFAAASLLAMAAAVPTSVQASAGSPHLDRSVLIRGCGSCHRGHGLSGTPMLSARASAACMRCHGGVSQDAVDDLDPRAARNLRDLRREFDMPYRHPIETADLHRRDETLPEPAPGTPRHVACLDCHDAHRPQIIRDRATLSVKPRPSTLRAHTFEYEVCYRCHGDSANLPSRSRNVRVEFDQGNRSFHPVEGVGPPSSVPSLRTPFTPNSILSCTDCHGGDAADGRRSVHGSNHEGMLVANYTTRVDATESDHAFRLCYRCHDRQSILNGSSFSGHTTHLTEPNKQTSCFTCHASHGSRNSEYLIRFNPVAVMATRSGRIEFRATAPGTGECYLTCHGAEHDPGLYCPRGVACGSGRVTRVQGADPLQAGSSPLNSPFDQAPDPFGPSPPPL